MTGCLCLVYFIHIWKNSRVLTLKIHFFDVWGLGREMFIKLRFGSCSKKFKNHWTTAINLIKNIFLRGQSYKFSRFHFFNELTIKSTWDLGFVIGSVSFLTLIAVFLRVSRKKQHCSWNGWKQPKISMALSNVLLWPEQSWSTTTVCTLLVARNHQCQPWKKVCPLK